MIDFTNEFFFWTNIKESSNTYSWSISVGFVSSVGFMSSANSIAYTENKQTKKKKQRNWQLQAFDPRVLTKGIWDRIKQKEILKTMHFLMEIHTSEKQKAQQEINPS